MFQDDQKDVCNELVNFPRTDETLDNEGYGRSLLEIFGSKGRGEGCIIGF